MLPTAIGEYRYGFIFIMHVRTAHIPRIIQPLTIVSSGVVALVIAVSVLLIPVIAIVVIAIEVLVWTPVIIVDMSIVFEALLANVRAGALIATLVKVDEIAVVAPVVVTALECAPPIPYFVDALSDMVVDALTAVLADVTIGFVSAIASVFASLMPALDFPVPPLSRAFGFDWRPQADFNCCDRAFLQARIPSYHVCQFSFAPPALPQFPNQEPPRPQQLRLPDFSMLPHLRHTALRVAVIVVATGVHWFQKQKENA